MPGTKIYDAIVIGSGITGGWAAKELTEKGLNVLLLEAGRPIVPEVDYVEHVPAWELKYRGWDNRESHGFENRGWNNFVNRYSNSLELADRRWPAGRRREPSWRRRRGLD